MKLNLSFDEISSDQDFEDLVAAYFRQLNEINENDISEVEIKKSGVGVDGGRDILVDFILSDEIRVFRRRWVVQCKFRNNSVSTLDINDINIPTLIHSYGADGYLLILKKQPTSKLTDLFERLNQNCNHGYSYDCWTGNSFLKQLQIRESIIQLYFPKYFAYISQIKEG